MKTFSEISKSLWNDIPMTMPCRAWRPALRRHCRQVQAHRHLESVLEPSLIFWQIVGLMVFLFTATLILCHLLLHCKQKEIHNLMLNTYGMIERGHGDWNFLSGMLQGLRLFLDSMPFAGDRNQWRNILSSLHMNSCSHFRCIDYTYQTMLILWQSRLAFLSN